MKEEEGKHAPWEKDGIEERNTEILEWVDSLCMNGAFCRSGRENAHGRALGSDKDVAPCACDYEKVRNDEETSAEHWTRWKDEEKQTDLMYIHSFPGESQKR